MERHAERRLITALFIDVVGSTDLTVRFGPERMKRTLDETFTHLRDLIAAHDGTIEKYIGDAIFVLFGAPVAHADDPERALRAAEACVRWAAEREAHSDITLAVRVGVETGEAIVDLEAAGGEKQQMAVGRPVNLASRLQQAADPGQVLVGPGCHEATADVAEFESLGFRDLKGLGEVPAWRFVRLTGVRVPAVPFFGRREELERLRSSFARARMGRAALAVVIGPPGQGKTRLAEELIRDVHGEARLLQARCRPGGEIGSLTPPETNPRLRCC